MLSLTHKHFFDAHSVCRTCGEHKRATVNGRWPTGTYMQKRLAELAKADAERLLETFARREL